MREIKIICRQFIVVRGEKRVAQRKIGTGVRRKIHTRRCKVFIQLKQRESTGVGFGG